MSSPRVDQSVRCPVRELSSPRVVQSASRPVHELAIRELSSYLASYDIRAWKWRGSILVLVLHKFVTYLLRHLPIYLQPHTHTWQEIQKLLKCAHFRKAEIHCCKIITVMDNNLSKMLTTVESVYIVQDMVY